MKRGGNWIMSAHEIGKYPNAYLSVNEAGEVVLSYFPVKDSEGYAFPFERRLARLVAKRILRALEATR